MRKQIFGLAVMGLMSNANAINIVIDAVTFTEWGTDVGATWNDMTGKHQVYFVPDADVSYGGNSAVLAPDGSLVGPCPQDDAACVPNWNIAKTQSSPFSITSKLKVTDFVPSSMMGSGWASAGWWLYPSYNPAMCGTNAFEKSTSFGLDKAGTMIFDLSYTKDMPLTIQFRGAGIDENDANQSPPRFSYTGTGAKQQVSIKVAQVKRAGWSIPTMYDPVGVTGIGFLRLVSANSQGASFPASEPTTTDFEFWSASIPSTYPFLEAIPLPALYQNCTSSNQQDVLLNDSLAVELLDLKGEILGKGLMSHVKQGLTPGSYLLRQGNSVESLVIQ